MNELIDQLEQVIEERLMQLKLKKEKEDGQTDQRKKMEDAIRMDKILNSLPEEERNWLEERLLEQVAVPEQEQRWYLELSRIKQDIQFGQFAFSSKNDMVFHVEQVFKGLGAG